MVHETESQKKNEQVYKHQVSQGNFQIEDQNSSLEKYRPGL